jgi:hypothetical protein
MNFRFLLVMGLQMIYVFFFTQTIFPRQKLLQLQRDFNLLQKNVDSDLGKLKNVSSSLNRNI